MANPNLGYNYQGRDGELRFLDKSQSGAGANGTPYGYVAHFEEMNLTLQERPRPQEFLRLDRERLNVFAHTQLGSDEPLAEGFDVSFGAKISSLETNGLMEFVGVRYMGQGEVGASSWNVKGTPAVGLVSTKGRQKSGDGLYGGGITDGRGSIVVLPALADPKKVCVDMETGWAKRDGAQFFGMRLKEVLFDPGAQRIAESGDFVTLTMTGRCYGGVDHITGFSRAMDVLSMTVLGSTLTSFSS